jgi:hypothetical protein
MTRTRKLDGFINTSLREAGEMGYGRRWVLVVPTDADKA